MDDEGGYSVGAGLQVLVGVIEAISKMTDDMEVVDARVEMFRTLGIIFKDYHVASDILQELCDIHAEQGTEPYEGFCRRVREELYPTLECPTCAMSEREDGGKVH
jgi:hypothetical protein